MPASTAHPGWSATSAEKFAVQLLSTASAEVTTAAAIVAAAALQAAFRKLKLGFASNSISVGQNPEIAFAVFFAELDYFLLDRRRIRFRLAEYQAPRGRGIDTVRFNRKVMIVTHDKGHRLELLRPSRLADQARACHSVSGAG
jgi:hypothetical protein